MFVTCRMIGLVSRKGEESEESEKRTEAKVRKNLLGRKSSARYRKAETAIR